MRLQNQIHKLQASGPDLAAPVFLYHPYGQSELGSGPAPRSSDADSAPGSSSSSNGSGETYMASNATGVIFASAPSEAVGRSSPPEIFDTQVRLVFLNLEVSLSLL